MRPFPCEIVCEQCIHLREALFFDNRLPLIPVEIDWRPGAKREVYLQAVLLAAAEQIEKIPGGQRLVIDEHADRVEVHRFDAAKIAINDLWIIPGRSDPMLEHVAV